MAAQDLTLGIPGQDNSGHTNTLHQGVAEALSAIQGQKINPTDVAPSSGQNPPSFEIKTEATLQEIIDGEKGRPRVDSSKNFLKMLFGRLKKQHPESLIKTKNQ